MKATVANYATYPYTLIYTIYGNGVVDANAKITNSAATNATPRIGLQMVLNPDMENAQWYGRGPHENYIDRKKSAYFGLYGSTVTDLFEHYVRAQSNGNREDIRWIKMTNSENNGLKITSKTNLCFTASHFKDKQPWDAIHDFALPALKNNEVYLCLDYEQRGLGNATCGPETLHQYQIQGNVTYTYVLRISSPNFVPTSVTKKNVENNGITVYPNPVNDKLYISLPDFHENGVVRVFDLYGNVIGAYPISSNSSTQVLNVNNLIKGVYFYTIKTSTSNYKGKFVKM